MKRFGAVLVALTSFNAANGSPCQSGLQQFSAGDYVQAQQLLWECIGTHPESGTYAFQLALTYRSLKNYESGLSRSLQLLQNEPKSVDLLYLAAYLHYRRNETKDSMALLSKAYRLAPEDWRIHQLFGLNYISFHMLEPAKLSLLKASALNPKNAELHYQIARLYFSLGSFVNSIEASKRALEIVPDYPEVYHNLALSYEGNGEAELAIENFEKALALNRKLNIRDEWLLIDYAVYIRMSGKPENSRVLLQEALAINPRSAKANYEMGELLRDMKLYREAKEYLEIAVNLDACNARALYGLAVVTRVLGDPKQASTLLQRFKQVDAVTKDGAVSRNCAVSSTMDTGR